MNIITPNLFMKPKKGHRESALHVEGKIALGRLLASRGFLIIFELLLADIVAFRQSGNQVRIICGEFDTTIRNILNNVRRNFDNGCNSLVIMVSNESVRASVRRLLARNFPASIQHRIGIITYDSCQNQLSKLSLHFSSNITGESSLDDGEAYNKNNQNKTNGVKL